MEQQRCKVRLPKRKKSFVAYIFSRNDDYNKAYLSYLIVILSDLHEFHSSALLNYCLNDEKNGDKQSTIVLSTICRQKAIDWEAYCFKITIHSQIQVKYLTHLSYTQEGPI